MSAAMVRERSEVQLGLVREVIRSWPDAWLCAGGSRDSYHRRASRGGSGPKGRPYRQYAFQVDQSRAQTCPDHLSAYADHPGLSGGWDLAGSHRARLEGNGHLLYGRRLRVLCDWHQPGGGARSQARRTKEDHGQARDDNDKAGPDTW